MAAASDETFAVLEAFLRELGPRESATGEELGAAEYLLERYEETGYSVELQPFTIERVSEENSGLAIESPVAEEIGAIPLTLTGIGAVSGPLVSVGLARTEDLTADVQSWHADSSVNFGWIAIGDESRSQTAKRFDSRENEDDALRPALVVVFAP